MRENLPHHDKSHTHTQDTAWSKRPGLALSSHLALTGGRQWLIGFGPPPS